MLRDLRIFRRNSYAGKAPTSESTNENLPVDPSGSSTSQLESDASRAPLITIQEPVQNPKPGLDQGAISRRKSETTLFRSQVKGSDSSRLPFRTPEKMVSRQRFGWGLTGDLGMNDADNGDDLCYEGPSSQLPPLSRGGSICPGGGFGLTTPRTYRTAAKASSVHSDCSSTQSTPTKSVTKPPNSGFSNSRPPVNLKSLEAILAGALRREKMADTTIKQLQAEIEQLNRLVRQREDDTQSSKMMLKFREDKIRRMEDLLEGQMPVDSYLMEEKHALSEEVQLLRARVDKNPEVTRFALENIRLLDQLRRFQDFYKEGERELLLAEVIELRNKDMLELHQMDTPVCEKKECSHEHTMEHAEEILNLQLELDILKTILAEEKSSLVEVEEEANHTKNELKSANGRILYMSKQYEDKNNELKDARSIIEALESEHILLINEMEEVRKRCNQQKEILNKQEQEIFLVRNQSGLCPSEIEKQSTIQEELRNIPHGNYENEGSPLQVKLKKMQASLEKARDLNMRCQSDQVAQTSLEQEMDEVRRQVEIETAEVIVCLQEELAALQKQADGSKQNELIAKQNLIGLQTELKELQVRLHVMIEENEKLGELIEEKDRDLRSLTEDWERLASEIADILADGNMSLEEATDQVDSICDSFPKRSWIGEQIERIIKGISERDLLIEELQKCLEEAQNTRCDMEWKLRSLRGATLAITEAQEQESNDKEQEIVRLTTEITEKMFTINELENTIEVQEEQIKKAELNATVAFMTVNKLSETNEAHVQEIAHAKLLLNESKEVISNKDSLLHHQISLHADANREIHALSMQLKQSQEHIAELQKLSQNQEMARELEQMKKEEEDVVLSVMVEDILKAKRIIYDFKAGMTTPQSCTSVSSEQDKSHTAQREGDYTVDSQQYITEDQVS
ncbi:hypothetical protein B296_00004359 [Ensete ventricosum]|uniref:Uncharacterized protein n=1 Tax=Ensete ventricosum TaxID=4639 RepID=A0A426YY34_ENSVE|nr:hypothetical protein B296_00004359 [Ensete ventricosum]